MSSSFIGIDIGTTSIKLSIIDVDKRILLEKEKPHHGQQECLKARNEQCPRKILRVLHELFLDAAKMDDKLSQLRGVGISGQMHGVVLWNSQSLTSIEDIVCSNLVTWMDGRCDEEFIKNLPKWLDKADPNIEKRIASGYGWATLAWMKQNQHLESSWDRAGTIMDLLAAYLIQSTDEVLMSVQNAASWGYVNEDDLDWTIKDVNIFPLDLFPRIVQPGTIVGKTKISLGAIPLGIPVYVPLGDLQASLLPILSYGSAVMHIGTSAQLSFVADSTNLTVPLLPTIIKVPYFDGNYLWVAASLNGGNTLDCFIRKIASWSRQLFGHPSVAEEKMANHSAFLERIFQPENTETIISIQPTFFGERHDSEGGARIEGLCADIQLETFICSIARGIVKNLAQMMPQAILTAQNIKQLKLVGKARQRIFADEAKGQFPNIEILDWNENEQTVSAAFGAAIHAREMFLLGH